MPLLLAIPVAEAQWCNEATGQDDNLHLLHSCHQLLHCKMHTRLPPFSCQLAGCTACSVTANLQPQKRVPGAAALPVVALLSLGLPFCRRRLAAAAVLQLQLQLATLACRCCRSSLLLPRRGGLLLLLLPLLGSRGD